MIRQDESIVYGLVATIYKHHPPKSGGMGGGAKSFRRLNDALWQVLSAAVTASLSFELEDVGDIYRLLGGSYWFGEKCGERFYSLAASHDNISACRSYEHWRNRKPFMWHGKRLYVGAKFEWADQEVAVTSFADSQESLTAYAYAPGRRSPGTPTRRFTIARQEFAVAMKALRHQDIRVKIGTLPVGSYRLVGSRLPMRGSRFTVLEDGKKTRLVCNGVYGVCGADAIQVFEAERW